MVIKSPSGEEEKSRESGRTVSKARKNITMKECSQKNNLKNCTCTYTSCPRRGICCECVAYHRKRGELPGCLFTKEAEKTYDRSIEKYLATAKKK